MVVAGWSVVYSGWGTVHGSNFTTVKDLKYVLSFALDHVNCNAIYKRNLEASQLCIGYSQESKYECMHKNLLAATRVCLEVT